MKYVLILATLAILAGCQTVPKVEVPKTVEVPVPVLCKTPAPDAPEYHYKPPYSTVFNGTKDLLGDRQQSLAYETQLLAALNSCK